MALSCGCNIQGGAPVSPETVKQHYKHTFEALLFWELIRTTQTDAHFALSEARINLINAIDALYPWASKE